VNESIHVRKPYQAPVILPFFGAHSHGFNNKAEANSSYEPASTITYEFLHSKALPDYFDRVADSPKLLEPGTSTGLEKAYCWKFFIAV